MRTWLKMTALMVPMLTASAAEAWQSESSTEPIVIGRPPKPTNNTMRFEGDCGATRYGVTLDDQYDDPARRLRSLTVNGRELSAAVRDQIIRHLRPGMWIMHAVIDQCAGTPPDRGRFRLTISERRQQTIETQLLDFWVTPDGSVSEVRFN